MPIPQIIQNEQSSSNIHNIKVPDFSAPTMQILRYMGNKRSLLPWLIPKLKNYLNHGDTILDLFAGTSSVGYALKPNARVIANDIQEYSLEISNALLMFKGKILDNEFDLYLSKAYEKNIKALKHMYSHALSDEDKFLNKIDYHDYFKFSNQIPTYGHIVSQDVYSLSDYTKEEYIKRKRRAPKSFPYILFSIYFSNNFFSLKQSIEIDSIKYAIDQTHNSLKRTVYTSCLLYAISKAVNSSGHFAEHLNAHSDKSQRIIITHRKQSVLDRFLEKLIAFGDIYNQQVWENKTYKYDYKKLIIHLKKVNELDKIKLIYIDPPYTTAQYSRYYHIPETLVKYDYPEITIDNISKNAVKGRYRGDRHQSTFSQITKAEKSFHEMFNLLSTTSNATLAVSYSDNSIIKPIEKLMEIAREYYEVTDVKNGYAHSAQGSRFNVSGKGNHRIHEYLLICKPKYKI